MQLWRLTDSVLRSQNSTRPRLSFGLDVVHQLPALTAMRQNAPLLSRRTPGSGWRSVPAFRVSAQTFFARCSVGIACPATTAPQLGLCPSAAPYPTLPPARSQRPPPGNPRSLAASVATSSIVASSRSRDAPSYSEWSRSRAIPRLWTRRPSRQQSARQHRLGGQLPPSDWTCSRRGCRFSSGWLVGHALPFSALIRAFTTAGSAWRKLFCCSAPMR